MAKIERICNEDVCTGCGACMQKCPNHAIVMVLDTEGFIRPVIDQDKCIGCELCLRVCPQNRDIECHDGQFFMGWNYNVDILKTSSSGGFFSLISDFVLKHDGVIFGVVQDLETFELHHDYAVSSDEVGPMRLSKYYQSNTRNSFIEVQRFLDNGIWVLFTGTACQVAGLYSFLNKDYEKLITIDVLCHGVASKAVIDSWIKGKEKAFKKKIKAFSFRVKDNHIGWQAGGGTRMKMEFEDGSFFIEDRAEDTYMIGFNKNLFLRESCYRCKYCGTKRVADFTIGDFWGCNREDVSEEQKKLGVSLVLLNTSKAHEIMEQCKDKFKIIEIDAKEAIPFNRALVRPNKRPKIRNWFYKAIKIVTYDSVIKCIFAKRFVKIKIKKILKRF